MENRIEIDGFRVQWCLALNGGSAIFVGDKGCNSFSDVTADYVFNDLIKRGTLKKNYKLLITSLSLFDELKNLNDKQLKDKDKGLFAKYIIEGGKTYKVNNPTKSIDAVILEFDDPLAREGIEAFVIAARANGYDELANDLMDKLDEAEFQDFNKTFSIEEIESYLKESVVHRGQFKDHTLTDYCRFLLKELKKRG